MGLQDDVAACGLSYKAFDYAATEGWLGVCYQPANSARRPRPSADLLRSLKVCSTLNLGPLTALFNEVGIVRFTADVALVDLRRFPELRDHSAVVADLPVPRGGRQGNGPQEAWFLKSLGIWAAERGAACVELTYGPTIVDRLAGAGIGTCSPELRADDCTWWYATPCPEHF